MSALRALRVPSWARRMVRRLTHPHTTVRWRLTLLYGAMFLASGAAMLAITYTLVNNAPFGPSPLEVQVSGDGPVVVSGGSAKRLSARERSFGTGQVAAGATIDRAAAAFSKPVPSQIKRLLATRSGRSAIRVIGNAQRSRDLSQLVEESAIALGIMALISTALGWLVAGRVLAPLRTITATTREISAANLNRRLALEGPRDELRQLSDTIDGLLARLEGAFVAQRRFVADASHELRTPLTTTRAVLELVLSDPRATTATFREACQQALDESTHQEQLIDSLLALAQGQRGLDRRERVDLGEITEAAAHSVAAEAAFRAVAVDVAAALEPAAACGDRRLLERLVSNLVQNGVRHNVAGGWVRVSVETGPAGVRLRVSNTGPVVPETDLARLLEPFQRLSGERGTHGDGLGLGLSIVTAIVEAHGAELTLTPRPDGGLEAEVRFQAVPEPVAVA